jgi:hypothetical protein
MTHEAALAVSRLAPEKFLLFSVALMGRQAEYFDEAVADEGRNHTYKRLAELAATLGVDKNNFLKLLKIGEQAGNAGNQVCYVHRDRR